jgi:hypothetical protein
MASIRMGIYRHYKGHLYQVIGLAHDANADALFDNRAVAIAWQEGNRLGPVQRIPEPLEERKVVVYMPLELDGAHLGPRMAVRTLEDFVRVVHPDGTPCTPGSSDCFDGEVPKNMMPRFTYLGPELTEDMLKERTQ